MVISMPETFIAKLQERRRLVIPLLITEALKLKAGNKIRVTVERVK